MKKALQQIEKVLTGLKAMYEYLSKDIQEIKATQLTQNKRHEELAQVLEKFLQDPKFQATVDWSRNEKVHSLLLLLLSSSRFLSFLLVFSSFPSFKFCSFLTFFKDYKTNGLTVFLQFFPAMWAEDPLKEAYTNSLTGKVANVQVRVEVGKLLWTWAENLRANMLRKGGKTPFTVAVSSLVGDSQHDLEQGTYDTALVNIVASYLKDSSATSLPPNFDNLIRGFLFFVFCFFFFSFSFISFSN